MKKPSIPILPIAYLPPVSYFAILHKADQVIIEQHETYPKQTYRNRCEIYSEKGKTSLTIPVKKPNGNQTKTSEIRIFNEDKWFVKHWRAIEIAYRTSPYFLFYGDELKMFFKGSYDSLLEFNMALIQYFCDLFNIQTPITISENYIENPETHLDFREILSPKKPSVINYFPEYTQVFNTKHGFIPNLSILDVLFNLGPESVDYISKLSFQEH